MGTATGETQREFESKRRGVREASRLHDDCR